MRGRIIGGTRGLGDVGTWGRGDAETRRLAVSPRLRVSLLLAMVVLTSLLYPSASEGQEDYSLLKEWGAQGSGDGQFDSPFGIAVDGSGNVYVADTGNARIQKFASTGDFLTRWGTSGSGDGQFNSPYGVAVDSSGYVYVADTGNNRIQKFTSNGVFVEKWGTQGSGDGQFSEPRDLAVDAAGYIYVADIGNSRIQKLKSDGTLQMQWRGKPRGIAVGEASGSGYVYMVNSEDGSVWKFTSDGVFEMKWGKKGISPGQFWNPCGIAVNGSENIFVADTNNGRIQKFESDGVLVTMWETKPFLPDDVAVLPDDVAVDGWGNTYAVSANSNLVQMYSWAQPPIANFSAAPKFGKSPLAVSFTDLSKNNPTSWQWDFGDGATSDSQHPTHTYTRPGGYRVSLIVVNLAGSDTASKPDYIHVIVPPVVKITSEFGQWESGGLTVKADATDADGSIRDVLFQYSLDGRTWRDIDFDTTPPYSAVWDTRSAIPRVDNSVWVKAVATDNDNLTGESGYRELGVDNESPTTRDDYDGEWHNVDLVITLTGTDNGSGMDSINYRINNGREMSVKSGSTRIRISTEGGSNVLEYWGVDNAGNVEMPHNRLSDIKLDKTAPTFSSWIQEPVDLISEYRGQFRVQVKVTDAGGSGRLGVPQFGYHIGDTTDYAGYTDMTSDANDSQAGSMWYSVWYFVIMESWNRYEGKTLYYRVQAFDTAGNVSTMEREELIESARVPPVVQIISAYKTWETDRVEIEAEAVDKNIRDVLFQYSLDGNKWDNIGSADTTPPYSVIWDTKSVIPMADDSVWVNAIATDNDNLSGESAPKGFGVDNGSPTTSDDYDGEWHNYFDITLTGDDDGSGVASISYKVNDGNEIFIKGESTKIKIDTEGGNNVLEYWGVDNVGNVEMPHNKLSDIRLDKTSPEFRDITDMSLTASTSTPYRVKFEAKDALSGVSDIKISYVDVSGNAHDDGPMSRETGDIWYYDIPVPSGGWQQHVLEVGDPAIRYSFRCADEAGNIVQSQWRDVRLESCRHDATGPLKAGDVLKVWTEGPDGKIASFDIEGLSKMAMTETSPGKYEGSYEVQKGDYVENAQVTCQLGDVRNSANEPVTIDAQAPEPPVELTAIPGPEGAVTLNWKGSTSSDVVNYRIYRTQPDRKLLDDRVLASRSSWKGTQAILEKEGNCNFGISAVDKVGNEGDLRSLPALVNIDGTPPEDVADLVAESLTGSLIELSWKPSSSDDLAEYEIAYGTRQTSTPRTSWTSEKLEDGRWYDFTVRAIDKVGNKSNGRTARAQSIENEPPTAAVESINGVQHSDVLIRYQLDDRDSDSLSIICEYLKANRWQPASVTGKTAGIRATEYNGEITWNSREDIPSTSGMDVEFRITPKDSRSEGDPDVTSYSLVNILGDYDDDGKVDEVDLAIFRTAWDEQDLSKELGPAEGAPPDMIPYPDGVIDFEDLAVFSLLWVWSAGGTLAAPIQWLVNIENTEPVKFLLSHLMPVGGVGTPGRGDARTRSVAPFAADGDILSISFPTGGLMGYVSIEYDADIISFVLQQYEIPSLEQPLQSNTTFLSDANHPGRIVLAFTDLFSSFSSQSATRQSHPSKGGATTVVIDPDWKADVEEACIVFRYDIRDLQNRTMASGTEIARINRLPSSYALLQNYPNPFNPETWIPFQLAEDADIVIRIYTNTGQLARTLDMGHRKAGFYTSKAKATYWDGRNESGEEVSSGVYFYTIKAAGFTATRKMLMLE